MGTSYLCKFEIAATLTNGAVYFITKDMAIMRIELLADEDQYHQLHKYAYETVD